MGLVECFKRYFEKRSAFFEGMGSLTLFPPRRNLSYGKDDLTPYQQDMLANYHDTLALRGITGREFRIAMKRFRKSLANKVAG